MKKVMFVVSDEKLGHVIGLLAQHVSAIQIEDMHVRPAPMTLEQPPQKALEKHKKKVGRKPGGAVGSGQSYGKQAILEYAAKQPEFSPTEVRKAYPPSLTKAISNALNVMRIRGEVEKIGANPFGAGFMYRLKAARGEDAERLLSLNEESRKAEEG